ncbi:MAG TPA: hypothetical protein VGO47_11530 [Chlamydiales bacterium]|nr:hypothetical protein [Chlamydiales bacterium]
MPSFNEGEVMSAIGISKVLKVGGECDNLFKEGDLVYTHSGWREYAVVPKAISRVIE